MTSGRPARARAAHAAIALLLASLLAPAPVRAAGARPAGIAADSIRYATEITDANRVGITISNYGFFGNNFNSRAPSFEYPLGSGYEHMARAGLWVGALAQSDTGAFIGVSSALVDNSQGSDALAETEFTPAGTGFLEISRIANSPNYSASAVSDQDLITEYSDMPNRPARGLQGEAHRSMKILVQQRVMSFSLRAAGSFVIPQFRIVNLGSPLRNVYVGLYVQLVSGDKNAYSMWPPSATAAPGSWYYKTHAEYDPERRLYEERYCAAEPFPNGCNPAYCPPWAGVKLLKAVPGDFDQRHVTFHWWSYSPGDTSRDTDAKRYALMSDGAIQSDFSTCLAGAQSCSPIMLLSVGPWPQLDPGDTLRVDYAFVGGVDDLKTIPGGEAALLENADFAQFTSDIDYRLPTPPPSPRVHVEAHGQRADVLWDDSPESVPDSTSPAPGHLDFEGYRVYFGMDRQHPSLVAQFDRKDPPHDTTGFNTGLDGARLDPPLVLDGVTYRYRQTISGLKDGFSYFGAVTSYDLGDTKVESLESGIEQNKFQVVPEPSPGERPGVTVFPNPYRVDARWDVGQKVRDHYLWFTNLPARCTIRIYTLAGDLVFQTRFDGAAYHGEGARGLNNPATDRDLSQPPFLSGASYAWNMVTKAGQAAATGLYLYSVEDEKGTFQRGKFLIVKSDRED